VSRHILVVDDEANLRELLRIVLEGEGYTVAEAATYAAAVKSLANEQYDLVLCDIFLPDGNGLDLVRTCHPAHPNTKFIVITAHTTPAHALAALRDGAVEYLSKPFDVEELKLVVAKQVRPPEPQAGGGAYHRLIGQSRAMRPLLERLPQVARSDATVLISGESGTGKELLARAIHNASPRSSRLFVPVNCGALPEGLLESELFGHVRGSFTGAVRDKRGLMQEAHGGTLFLDEVSELAPNTQVALLRALQERTIRPVGDTREVEVNVRILAATNQDLSLAVKEGRFREDFFYRINVIQLHLPTLRERREDIPELTRHFVERACGRAGIAVKQIHRDAMEPSHLITVSSLPPAVLGSDVQGPVPPMHAVPEEGFDIEAYLDSVRRDLMHQALERCGGVQKKAAELLRMSYRAFRYHAEKYNLITEA
jgi:two-component system response regulator PilR (NtrC family)